MDVSDIEVKRRKFQKIAMIVLGFLGCLVIGPIIGTVLTGAAGLLAFGAIALVSINLAPAAGRFLSNMRIKLEASRNPVETLQNDYLHRQEDLSKFRSSITDFKTAIGNFESKLLEFGAKWKGGEAEKMKNNLLGMKQLYEVRQRKYSEAKESLEQYSLEIEKAEAIWQMGQEAKKMNAAAGMSDDDFMHKIETDTAINSIQGSMNRAFAELETSLIEEKEKIKLEAPR